MTEKVPMKVVAVKANSTDSSWILEVVGKEQKKERFVRTNGKLSGDCSAGDLVKVAPHTAVLLALSEHHLEKDFEFTQSD